MEREEERERRRLRDRQRRQSMSKEQRERHLARRRRNYQLRRQRAANAQLLPLPQSTSSEDFAAATASHLPCLTPSTPSHHTLLHPTSQILQGSSIELEGFSRRLRLSTVKRLARNLGNPKSVALDNPHVASEFMPASGNSGTTKTLRLNSVKRLARSLSFAAERTTIQK
ncbi:hypothetical protein PHAVU_003G084900 [Phaseolus vulgaris]|uniref:Uncharacterized protein n=1 Tax=Phaseolus vulgaris TaxID=3885 RepID=V7C762_PHAVU|nr:hypothetical protein PHAVU_003G084900g [Phaseolus vulgaris]ESW26022.1 hypothetical protein PHAVU_003G084900g [Phaseolus vulgaris]